MKRTAFPHRAPARAHLAPFMVILAIMTIPPAAQAAAPPLPISSLPAPALPADAKLALGDTLGVIEVIDADTLRLAATDQDGPRQVRLVGLQGPKLPLGRPNFVAWPLAPAARDHLLRLVGGKPATLHYGGAREDRHGRLLAHLTVPAGDGNNDGGGSQIWVQGAMLAAGYARVYSFDDNRRLIAEMLALEAEARAARRGIWGHSYYRIRTPDELADATDSFQIIEGRVRAVGLSRDRAYLNFGADYKTDFTVAIAKRHFRNFGRGFDPKRYEARNIRVRGWVEAINGPSIDVTHSEQIEVLTP